jgi:hypothetical protein
LRWEITPCLCHIFAMVLPHGEGGCNLWFVGERQVGWDGLASTRPRGCVEMFRITRNILGVVANLPAVRSVRCLGQSLRPRLHCVVPRVLCALHCPTLLNGTGAESAAVSYYPVKEWLSGSLGSVSRSTGCCATRRLINSGFSYSQLGQAGTRRRFPE